VRVNRGLLGWGVFFIVLGAVPLAVDNGLIDPKALHRAWELWPFILVGIGLALVLRRTRFAVVGRLVVAVTLGLMAGALLAGGGGFTGIGSITSCGVSPGSGGGTAFAAQTGMLGSNSRIELDMNCGELDVTAASGSGWSVAGTSDRGQGPAVTASDRLLKVAAPDRTGIDVGEIGWHWQVVLPQDGSVDLDLSVNAGSASADLAGMHADAVDVSVNAGDARIDMGGAAGPDRLTGSVNAGSLSVILPAGSMTGSISVNAGSADVCVPDGVALKLQTGGSPLGSYDLEGNGLVQSGSTWSTPGYATATVQIALELDANLGSITLNPGSGCD